MWFETKAWRNNLQGKKQLYTESSVKDMHINKQVAKHKVYSLSKTQRGCIAYMI